MKFKATTQPSFNLIPYHSLHLFLPRLAMAKMDDCLKKAADARRLSISLGNLAYSGEVCKELLEFSTKMEKVYRNLQKLLNDKSTDESKFHGLLAIINEKLEWFTKAEARFGNHCYICFGCTGVLFESKTQ